MPRLCISVFALLLCLSGCFDAKKIDTTETAASAAPQITIKEPVPGDFSRNGINAVLVAQNSVWVGTDFGIYRYSMDLKEETERHLEEHKITRLVEVDGVIYAVSATKGLLYLPFRALNFSQAESPRIRDILVPTNEKALYCATSHGIDVFRNGSWSNIRINSNHEFQSNANDVLALAQDSQGNIWIGTSFGLYRMTNPSNFTFLYGDYQIVQGTTIINRQGNCPLQGNLFYNIYSDRKSGLLLFSTNGGLAMLKNPAAFNNNSEWVVYTGEHSRSVMQQSSVVTVSQPGNSPLPSNFVQTALQVGDTTYIGTESGLSAIKDGKWFSYNLDNGLAGDNIKALYLHETDNKYILYVGTNGGLSVITQNKPQL